MQNLKNSSKMKYIITICISLWGFCSYGQVGIGTASPSNSSKLDISAADKGILIPRVALTATTNTGPITGTLVEGLLVYNTASAGTSPNAVTPGFYFYNGSKWQRLINQQPDATVEFNTTNPNSTSPAPVFNPNTPQSRDYIYVSSVDNSQWTWNGTAYVTYAAPASTAWYLSSSTNDAGSNKSSSIYRSGKVGIGGSTPNATLDVRSNPASTTDPGFGFFGVGTTSSTAAAAGAGAIKYSTSSGGLLEYSNGINWNTLGSTVQKTVVTGYFSGTYSTGVSTLTCIETADASLAFASNTFTAPRTGLYLITANLLTTAKDWDLGEELNITFNVGGTDLINSGYFSQSTRTSAFGGPTLSAVVPFTAGQTAIFRTYSAVRGFTLYGAVYNRFSITEL
jgi:hypothetical protein